jgi:hypothetical protein
LSLKLYNEFETKSNLSYESYTNNLGNKIIDNPREFHKFIASKRKTNGFPAIMHLDDNRASNPQHISYLFANRFKKVYSPSSNSVSPDFSYTWIFFLMFQQLTFLFKTFTFTCLNELIFSKFLGFLSNTNINCHRKRQKSSFTLAEVIDRKMVPSIF